LKIDIFTDHSIFIKLWRWRYSI